MGFDEKGSYKIWLDTAFRYFCTCPKSQAMFNLDDVLKSEKALRYYSYLRNRQFLLYGNNRQLCLRSTVYPFAK